MLTRMKCLDVLKLAFPIQLQILLMDLKLSLQQVQTEFVIALSIQPGTLAAINLVLKEGKKVVPEWMSAALQSSPSLPASSHVTGAFSVS